MKNLRMRKFLALASMTSLMIFFQNCADVQWAKVQGQEKTEGAIDSPANSNVPGETIVIDSPDTQIAGSGLDFAAACKDLRLFGIKNILIDAKNVEGLKGQVIIKSDRVELIRDHSSVLVVVGHTSTAMIDNIIDVHGHTVICNAVVDRIESVSGTLVLVDTIVNHLVDQRGNLVSIRSKIKNQVDVKE